MEKIVIDTDIIIDFLRTKAGLFPDLLESQENKELELYISSVTVFEIFGGQSAEGQENNLLELVSKLQVVAFDQEIAKLAGEINRKSKYVLKLTDLAIGATCLTVDAFLATRNRKHFQKIPGLKFFKLPK